MYSKIISGAVMGVDGTMITVEADVNDGLPTLTMVGYLSSSVREAGERVRTALKNSGYHLPPKRITINLSPANVRKDGSGYDLPIALAVLMSLGISIEYDLSKTMVIGELGLDGTVKPISGVLPMVHMAYKEGMCSCIVPYENAGEAALINGIEVIPVRSLTEMMELVQGRLSINPYKDGFLADSSVQEDMSDIKGQEVMKRGMEIAAAGFHNVLMSGAAGAGKSMLARRLPSIMPELTLEESIEVTKIYSVSGMLKENSRLVNKRPFRSPHHTISAKALVGGGSVPRPGEISLAHKGVLFLDELPEFNKNTLEVLRQPIEDKRVTISRLNNNIVFPADFMLVAAMNPCPCGYYPNIKKCTCSSVQIKRYREKISGPLLDRIDINILVRPVEYKELFAGGSEESSEVIKLRVGSAIERQKWRYRTEGFSKNSELPSGILENYIKLGIREQAVLESVYEKKELSARGAYRIMKLARTIADLDEAADITMEHLQEAIFFRQSERSGELDGI